jgi:hypothetical protein
MPEPMMADTIKTIHKYGWYMTFMYEKRRRAENAKNSTGLLGLFLRHVLEQAVQQHLGEQLRELRKPILEEARQRGCLYFKCRKRFDQNISRYSGFILHFHNGKDEQYSRSLSYVRLGTKYDLHPDSSYLD